METKEENLKGKYLSWLESIKIRRIAYLQAKEYLKQAQEDLRIAKKVYNRTYNDWKEARVEAERTKRRWKTYPYQLRLWAKNNFGKVMDNLENGFGERREK